MAGTISGRQQNQARMLQLLWEERELTKQEIAARLQLSMPTALQCINELTEWMIVEECGTSESTGGRKAKKLGLRRTAGYSLGIDVALHHVELVLTDLLGECIDQTIFYQPFHDEPDWYQALAEAIQDFLQGQNAHRRPILCAGLSFPGIVDEQAEEIVHSHIFGLQHVSLNRFARAVPFPLVVANDANCGCFAELSPEHTTYLYVSLNESVGGALMMDGQLHLGDTWQAGEIGHMLLIPGGTTCYCGKKGCADSYLSPRVLQTCTLSLKEFFHALAVGKEDACAQWETYLDNLAILLTNLRMLMNVDLIIGGAIGSYITPYLSQLTEKAVHYDRFARDVDYIYSCKRTKSAFAVGAAMLALKQHSRRILLPCVREEGRTI